MPLFGDQKSKCKARLDAGEQALQQVVGDKAGGVAGIVHLARAFFFRKGFVFIHWNDHAPEHEGAGVRHIFFAFFIQLQFLNHELMVFPNDLSLRFFFIHGKMKGQNIE